MAAPAVARAPSAAAGAGAPMTATTSVRASKTWVLPPRPKPGRKSKKDLAAAAAAAVAVNEDKEDDEEAEEVEKVLNRTKQKASRERKQEYIAELEAKVRNYEQGDGERASFFQGLAKTYSEQNAALTAENEELKKRLALYESGQMISGQPVASTSRVQFAPQLTRKASSGLVGQLRGKRQRTNSVSSASSSSYQAASSASFATTASTVTAQSPGYIASPHAYASPSPASSSYVPPSPPVSLGLSPSDSSHSQASDFAAGKAYQRGGGCGVCDSSAGINCICDDLGIHDNHDTVNFEDLNLISSGKRPAGDDRCGFCTESTSGSCICAEVGLRKMSTSRPMRAVILGNQEQHDKLAPLPPSRLARPSAANLTPSSSGSTSVRLRLPKRGIAAGQIWRIDTSLSSQPLKQQSMAISLHPGAAAGVALRRKLIKVGSRLPCSGDPKNCLACADDPAGQAFCSALSTTVCSLNPCASCPNRPSPLANEVAMRPASPLTIMSTEAFSAAPSIHRRNSSARDEVPHAMIPCSDAWATLREHPNIGYANLDMLASVVAKRTQCSGPDEKRDKDGKIIEVDQQGVEEALDLLDHMRDEKNATINAKAV